MKTCRKCGRPYFGGRCQQCPRELRFQLAGVPEICEYKKPNGFHGYTLLIPCLTSKTVEATIELKVNALPLFTLSKIIKEYGDPHVTGKM